MLPCTPGYLFPSSKCVCWYPTINHLVLVQPAQPAPSQHARLREHWVVHKKFKEHMLVSMIPCFGSPTERKTVDVYVPRTLISNQNARTSCATMPMLEITGVYNARVAFPFLFYPFLFIPHPPTC
jgi:hypothetical protein